MTNIKYSNGQRLALAVKRERELIAERATMADADIAELVGAEVDADVTTTARTYTWAEFTAAFRAGDVLNAHRAIIERGGALR